MAKFQIISKADDTNAPNPSILEQHDFLGSSGLRLMQIGHQHGVALNGEQGGRWLQTFGVLCDDEPGGDVTEKLLAGLERALEEAIEYHDPELAQDVPYWLAESSDWEDENDAGSSWGMRSAVIYDYELEPAPSDQYRDPRLAQNNSLWIGTLAITRGPWESVFPETYTPAGVVGADADFFTIPTAQVDGNVRQRISQFTFHPDTGHEFTRFWFAIRRRHFGAYESKHLLNTANSDVTVYPADTGDTFDADLATILRCSFTTHSDLKFRFSVKVGSAYQMIGRHAFQLVMKTSAGAKARVRVSTSYADPANASGTGTTLYQFQREEVVGPTTIWRVHDQGIGQIPAGPWDVVVRNNLLGTDVYVNVEAELLEGTPGTDYVDFGRLFILPAEHRLWMGNVRMTDDDSITIYTTPTEQVVAHVRATSGAVKVPMLEHHNWFLPNVPDTHYIYVVADDLTNGYLDSNDIVIDSFEWRPRWRSYRDDLA